MPINNLITGAHAIIYREFFFMCTDIHEFVASMQEKEIACTPIQSMSWGELTRIRLPGGGDLGVYQPRHARPAETS